MPQNSLEQWIEKVRQKARFRLQIFFESRYWVEKWAFVIVLFTWLYAFPSYQYFLSPEPSHAQNWAALEKQFQHPFASASNDPNVHSTQARFRLLIPLLGQLTRLPPLFFIFTMPLVGWFFTRYLIRSVRAISNSDRLAFLAGGLVLSSYVGRAFTTDVMGYFDGYAFLFLLIAFFSRNAFIVFLTLLAAFFVDERSLLSFPVLIVASYFQQHTRAHFFRFLTHLRSPVVPLVGAIVIYLVLRLSLKSFLGFSDSVLQSDLIGLQVLRNNYQVFPLGWLSALHGWLLLLFVPAGYLWQSGNRMAATLYFIYLIMSLFLCQMVLDVTRSTTYLFPGVLLAIVLLSKFEQGRFTRSILLLCTAFSILIPPLVTIGATVIWQGPVFPKILKLLGLVAVM